jgi:hypothetical protein
MSSNLKITIRFIRSQDALAKTDDMVYITRYAYNQYNLSYTYGEAKVKTAHNLVLSDKAVFRWMRATIAILEKDADPFHQVQMDTPFMPSVLFNVNELGAAYHPLLDALEFHLDNWPAPPVLPSHEGEEEADDEGYYQGEEYDDMPPLVSMSNSYHGRQHLFLDEEY